MNLPVADQARMHAVQNHKNRMQHWKIQTEAYLKRLEPRARKFAESLDLTGITERCVRQAIREGNTICKVRLVHKGEMDWTVADLAVDLFSKTLPSGYQLEDKDVTCVAAGRDAAARTDIEFYIRF